MQGQDGGPAQPDVAVGRRVAPGARLFGGLLRPPSVLEPLPSWWRHRIEAPPPPDVSVELIRPDDLVVITFQGYNLRLDTVDGSPYLVRDQPGQPAYLVAVMQPQSIVEEALPVITRDFLFFEVIEQPEPQPPPLRGRMAGPTRIAFQLPDGVDLLPYSYEGLLGWSWLPLSLPPASLVDQAVPDEEPPPIAPPAYNETSIELPYRVALAPDAPATFVASTGPVANRGRIELWHARLAAVVTADGGDGEEGSGPTTIAELDGTVTATARAVWSPDYPGAGEKLPDAPEPFPAAMTALNRAEAVILTSGFSGYAYGDPGATAYTPRPLEVHHLELSALGGRLHSRGDWTVLVDNDKYFLVNRYGAGVNDVDQITLSQWVHVAAQGRDHYVRIVNEGFLFPFGHRAAMITVTERRFDTLPAGGAGAGTPVAELFQRRYIIVRRPLVELDPLAYPHQGREMPLLSVRLTTLITPDLLVTPISGASQPLTSWVVDTGGTDVHFHAVGVDAGGATVDFTTPLIYVDGNKAQDVGAVIAEWARASETRISIDLGGKRLHLAEPTPGTEDTRLVTDAVVFDAVADRSGRAGAGFLPVLRHASVHVDAVEHLLGRPTPSQVQLYQGFLDNGFDANVGLFAACIDSPGISFSADKSGGLATPNLDVSGIGRLKGAVAGDVDVAAQGNFDPKAVFGSISGAHLLGSVSLGDLISGAGGQDSSAPQIAVAPVPGSVPPQTVTTLSWHPPLNQGSYGPVTVDGGTDLTITSTITRPASPTQADAGTFVTRGTLQGVSLDLGGIISLPIPTLHFEARSGSKVQMNIDVGKVAFQGALQFLQDLAEIIPSTGPGGGGPSIDVTADGVSVGYALGIPPLTLGVFALHDLTFRTATDIPFADGTPTVDFAFADRHHPCLLTVELLGGGGFLHVQLDSAGIRMLEGQIEFGGDFSLDLVVASGGVHIMAGIYFMLDSEKSQISGFVDAGGELSVLGIVSVSVDFNLSLTYQAGGGNGKVIGRATLTVAVHVAFFSKSVELSVERSYGSGAGDPTADQVIPDAATWDEYAGAFA